MTHAQTAPAPASPLAAALDTLVARGIRTRLRQAGGYFARQEARWDALDLEGRIGAVACLLGPVRAPAEAYAVCLAYERLCAGMAIH